MKERASARFFPFRTTQNPSPKPPEKSETQPRRIRDPSIEVALSFGEESSLRNDPILGHFDLVHSAKREEELHEVRRRILRDLADNSTDSIGNRSVEDDRAHTYAC